MLGARLHRPPPLQSLLDYCCVRLCAQLNCELACELLMGPPSILHLEGMKSELIEFLVEHHGECVETRAWKELAASGNEPLLSELFRGFGECAHRFRSAN